MNVRTVSVAIGLVVALLVGVLGWRSLSASDDEARLAEGTTFTVAPVERRDLTDEISVRGEIRREELQRVTSGIDGRVSSVLVEDGDTIDAGDVIYALDGRAAVAVNGDFSFFRELDVGSDGPDVLQLERILSDEGYQVGIVDELYTEQTRAGLSDWQVAHGYGGATPEPDENIVINLQPNSAGYTVGPRNTISVTLGPTVPRRPVEPKPSDDEESLGDFDSETGSLPSFLRAQAQSTPAIEVTVAPGTVAEGDSATFTFTSDIAMPTDTIIDYTIRGDATGGSDYDDDGLDGTFLFPGGYDTFDLVVQTLKDSEIETDETLTITVGAALTSAGENYRLGPLKEATLTITSPSDELAGVSVSADQASTVEGGRLGFTFEVDLISNRALTIFFTIGGSAGNGSDYTKVDEFEIELPAGAASVAFNVQTRNDNLVENDETVVVSINSKKKKANYVARGSQSASSIIEADASDLPELTITGGDVVGEGELASFEIHADQALTRDTSINFSVGGSATPGLDYQELTGTVVMDAGQSNLRVAIRTLDDDVVFRPADMVVADWPARIGTVSVDEGEFILLGQEVLTLTEPDFTITFLLSPSDRGSLDVGLTVRVELQASDQDEVFGFITELDDTASVDPNTGETYEGVVETLMTLDAVDGAGVNVDVIRDERLDVITVPVAAVLQNGEGEDVVRVALTDGSTRQIRVEVGLSQGAFVEIRSGLSGNELVVVET